MNIRLISTTFYLGLCMLIVGTLFKLQHWPGAQLYYLPGILLALVCFIAIVVEIFRSRKAKIVTKLVWGIPFVVVPAYIVLTGLNRFSSSVIVILLVFICGRLYLSIGRKKFVQLKSKHHHIEFDSIDV